MGLPDDAIDLGGGFAATFFTWDPNRDLNPQYVDVASVERAGIILWKDGVAIAAPWFDTPETRAIPWTGKRVFWRVVSLDPLHLEPSIQTYRYEGGHHVPDHHGFIRGGRWVPA